MVPRTLSGRLLAAGVVLLVATVVVAVLTTRHGGRSSAPPQPPSTAPAPTTTAPTTTAPPTTAPATTVPATTAPTTTAPTTTVPATTSAPPPTTAPPPVAFSWRDAGGLVFHATSIDPTVLGQEMRAAGFGWVAVSLADGLTPGDATADWIARFRQASGNLPVGGWSVLRTQPVQEARLAASLLAQNGLQFYVADAEQEYGYTKGADHSSVRYARSRAFVDAFRAAAPTMPAGVSSYCRPDQHDLDWSAWAGAGFVFLPQAYPAQLGPEGDPAVCVRGAARWFPVADVHPTLGTFDDVYPSPDPGTYAQLLAEAGTTGFSLYPAENAASLWSTYGQEIQTLHVAEPVPAA